MCWVTTVTHLQPARGFSGSDMLSSAYEKVLLLIHTKVCWTIVFILSTWCAIWDAALISSLWFTNEFNHYTYECVCVLHRLLHPTETLACQSRDMQGQEIHFTSVYNWQDVGHSLQLLEESTLLFSSLYVFSCILHFLMFFLCKYNCCYICIYITFTIKHCVSMWI